MGKKKTELTPEMLAKALEESKGFILASVKWLRKEHEIIVSSNLIKSRLKEWEMDEWLDDLRKSLVEDCMNRVFYKGIQKLDNHCIFWVLEKYGHHVDFLGSKDTETESKKGWKELLAYVKADIESDTDQKPEREHS